MELFTCLKIFVWKKDPRKVGKCALSVIYCVVCVCSFFRDFPFSSSQWHDERDALIGQFNCLLSFQPRSQSVLSFN